MNHTTEKFSSNNTNNLQALESISTQAFSGVEQLVELNLTASKASLNDSFSYAQAVLGAKDAQEVMALQAGMLKPLAEKSASYAQHLQTILADSSAAFTKAIEANAAQVLKAFGSLLENITKNVPAGSDSAIAAFKSTMDAGQSAIESAKTEAKKVVEAAQSSLADATAQTAEAVKKATKVA